MISLRFCLQEKCNRFQDFVNFRAAVRRAGFGEWVTGNSKRQKKVFGVQRYPFTVPRTSNTPGYGV